MKNLLYRGVNPVFYKKYNGKITPKENKEFIKPAEYGRAEYGNNEYGKTILNAVIEHQQHQAGYSTSGISTTPILERAIYYATHGGEYEYGYIYIIDRDLCPLNNIKIYDVNSTIRFPSVPEDDEVILVDESNCNLINKVVIDIKTT